MGVRDSKNISKRKISFGSWKLLVGEPIIGVLSELVVSDECHDEHKPMTSRSSCLLPNCGFWMTKNLVEDGLGWPQIKG